MMKQYRLLIVIIVVLAFGIWIDLPGSPGIPNLIIRSDIKTHLGLDLIGGVQALLEADLPEGSPVTYEDMQTATRIVENRVNGLGVEEAVVQQAGDRRIVVEIPGVEDPEQAIATIRETGLLEFVHMGTNPLADGTEVVTDFRTASESDASTVPPSGTPTPETPADQEAQPPAEDQGILHTVMTGEEIDTVNVATDNLGRYVIDFTLKSEGTKLFADYTTQNTGQYLGIVLDKKVISAPVVNEPITEGQGQISGSFDLESANALAVQLRYGSLPIPLKVVESRTVGPTLGEDSLQKSMLAGAVGFIIVVLFMSFYYRLPGVIAVLAIISYATVTLALFRLIPITLTLPGFAGLIISTGSALDANILIFERLKEELRAGRTLRQAVDLGWQRAWPSIRDSNIATLITSGILFWFGSSFGATIVKGFSVTLALGVIVSLFTAIIVTRTFLSLVLHRFIQVDYVRWFGL